LTPGVLSVEKGRKQEFTDSYGREKTNHWSHTPVQATNGNRHGHFPWVHAEFYERLDQGRIH